MRPLQIHPRHPITRLALSPDGRRLAVVQLGHGLRVFDTTEGREEEHFATDRAIYQRSPTLIYTLNLTDWALRLAEVSVGQPGITFQAGWRLAGRLAVPPDDPIPAPIVSHPSDSRMTLVRLPSAPGSASASLYDCSISADHRLAVGRRQWLGPLAVIDLTTGRLSADLVYSDVRADAGPLQATFTPSADRVVVVTTRNLLVFDLPPLEEPPTPEPEPPRPSLLQRAARALILRPPNPFTLKEAVWPTRVQTPVLSPAVVAPLSQPQPDPLVPPFALLPCGTKLLVRGQKSRIELRDLSTGAVLTVWKWGLPRVQAVCAAGDGLTAAAAGLRGQVVLWDLE